MPESFFDILKQTLFGAPAAAEGEGDDTQESLLHMGWEQREQSFYPGMFGKPDGAQQLLTEEIFRKDFGRNAVHPFWLHHGVISFPPTAARSTWLYATSGMSNAFDSQVEEWSGLGVEFILETNAPAPWAVGKMLRLMAFNLLIAAGHYKDQSDLTFGSIVRLGEPVTGEDNCCLMNFIALKPSGTARDFTLVTGKVELLQMVAISDAEADFAEKEGFEALAEKLAEAATLEAIDTDRKSVV